MALKTLLNMVKKKPDIAGILAIFSKDENSGKELLYKTYYGYIMAVVIRYTPAVLDAEELVNDSFMKIFKYLPRFIPPVNPLEVERAFKGWMARIASRTAIDFRNKPKLLIHELDLSEHHHPVFYPPEMFNLDVRDLLALLNGLTEPQRLVFNLHEIEGFSHAEIANILQIQEGASRVHLTRAKNKLRQLYNETILSNGTY